METLIIASLITAFIAGIAALFAPCCITVLLPSYLGSIFREKRKVFLMTFVFFLGLLAVFLPLGMGAAGLGKLFSRYHDQIYIVGGVFFLFLGASILLGLHFSMPFSIRPKLKMPVPSLRWAFFLDSRLCVALLSWPALLLCRYCPTPFFGEGFTLSLMFSEWSPRFF